MEGSRELMLSHLKYRRKKKGELSRSSYSRPFVLHVFLRIAPFVVVAPPSDYDPIACAKLWAPQQSICMM